MLKIKQYLHTQGYEPFCLAIAEEVPQVAINY